MRELQTTPKGWPTSVGIGGRIASQLPADLRRITQQDILQVLARQALEVARRRVFDWRSLIDLDSLGALRDSAIDQLCDEIAPRSRAVLTLVETLESTLRRKDSCPKWSPSRPEIRYKEPSR